MPIHLIGLGDLGVAVEERDTGPVRTVEVSIPYGNAGILVSANKLTNMVRSIKTLRKDQDRIRPLASQIVRACRAKDYMCEARSIYNWVKNNIRWTKDPNNVEMLQDPLRILDLKTGDCDCMTILMSSLLQSVGFRTRIVLVATRPWKPKNFNHIFTEALVEYRDKTGGLTKKWVPMDTTPLNEKGKVFPFGVLPPALRYKRIEVV